jgi:hypothetical protein
MSAAITAAELAEDLVGKLSWLFFLPYRAMKRKSYLNVSEK